MTTDQRLLTAAAAFIRRHPNGTDDAIKELMAGAVDDAAKRLGTVDVPTVVAAPPVVSAVSDDNMRILLRAAGYKQVKGASLDVYRLLLGDQTREWNTPAVAKKLRRSAGAISHVLRTLFEHKAIVQTRTGFYRAT